MSNSRTRAEASWPTCSPAASGAWSGMTGIQFPKLDPAILARRETDHRRPRGAAAARGAHHHRGRAACFRDGRAHRLPADAARGRAAAFDGRISTVMAYLHKEGVNVRCARRRHVAGGRAPSRKRNAGRPSASPKWRGILDIDYANRTIRVQSGVTNLSISNAGRPPSASSTRPDPVVAACLHHRRQYRHEFRRRALPQIRRGRPNNVLGVKMVLGSTARSSRSAGPYLDSAGPRSAWPRRRAPKASSAS